MIRVSAYDFVYFVYLHICVFCVQILCILCMDFVYKMIRLYDQGVCIGINDQLAPFQHQQHMKGREKGNVSVNNLILINWMFAGQKN